LQPFFELRRDFSLPLFGVLVDVVNAIGLAANKPTNTSVPSPMAASLPEDLEIQPIMLRETSVQSSRFKVQR
jgi:hypothetical protein